MNTIQYSRTLGAIAFAAGLPCVPALHSDFMMILRDHPRPMGSELTIKELDAWQSGWTLANLASNEDGSVVKGSLSTGVV